MNPSQRIRMIRLMEKLEKHPTYAKTLGIEAACVKNHPIRKYDPKGLTNA